MTDDHDHRAKPPRGKTAGSQPCRECGQEIVKTARYVAFDGETATWRHTRPATGVDNTARAGHD